MEVVVDLMAKGQLKTDMLISDVISLDEVMSTGFKRMMADSKDVFRILVNPRD